jgi:hypothetical protein
MAWILGAPFAHGWKASLLGHFSSYLGQKDRDSLCCDQPGGVKVRAEESAWLKFVDRKAENDSWHGRYALEFCPLADIYASEDHSSMRIPKELSRAVLRINIEGSGKGRGGQVAQAIIRYECVRPRSNYMFSATIISSRYRCRYPQPRKRSWRNP